MIIHHHLGLGDHIICNGLVRYLATERPVELFCKHTNLVNIELMYKDNKNITLIDVYNDQEAQNIASGNKDYIRLGVGLNHNYQKSMERSWDKVFYDQLNIPYEYSWNLFTYNKSLTQNKIPNTKYAFICNKGSDGIDGIKYDIVDPNLMIVYSNIGNFFDNIDLIQNASEIHCINSAYIHLIDRIEIPTTIKLCYHKNFVKKPFSDFTLKKEWILI